MSQRTKGDLFWGVAGGYMQPAEWDTSASAERSTSIFQLGAGVAPPQEAALKRAHNPPGKEFL
jgi:hypothetical protein